MHTLTHMMILLVANLTVTACMFGVIWIVQLVHYPMLAGLDDQDFVKWHVFHSRQISFVVAPLMVGELGLSCWLAFSRMDFIGWSLLSLTVATWAATFLLSVPIHESLGRSASPDTTQALIKRLVRTNWPRTILYSIKFCGLIALFLKAA